MSVTEPISGAPRTVWCQGNVSASLHAVNGSTNLDYVRIRPAEPGWWEVAAFFSPSVGDYYCVSPWEPDCPVRECEVGNYSIHFEPVFIMRWMAGDVNPHRARRDNAERGTRNAENIPPTAHADFPRSAFRVPRSARGASQLPHA